MQTTWDFCINYIARNGKYPIKTIGHLADIVVVGGLLVVSAVLPTGWRFPGIGSVAILLCVLIATWRLYSQGTDWTSLGVRRTYSCAQLSCATVVCVAVSLFFASTILFILVQKYGWHVPDTSRYGNRYGNTGLLFLSLAMIWTTAAFGEELLLRVFLLDRLLGIFGRTKSAIFFPTVIQAILFGLMHSFQGSTGVVVTTVGGLIFGIAYLILKNIWPVMLAHGIFDTISLLAAYIGH